MSMSSRQRTLTATISSPLGFLPRENAPTPHCPHGTNDHSAPRFWQSEQLHAVTLPRSVVTSKRTSPQWQPPVYVLVSDMACGLFLLKFDPLVRPLEIDVQGLA